MATHPLPNTGPNPDRKVVLAFDAYGTLLSTDSIAKKLTDHFGEEKANALAATWRKYQLEYTWRLNSMGKPMQYLTDSELQADTESSLSRRIPRFLPRNAPITEERPRRARPLPLR